MVFDGRVLQARLVARAGLAPDTNLTGPALVVEASSATIVPPGWSARALPGGVLMLVRQGE